jgi:hypothetical protein
VTFKVSLNLNHAFLYAQYRLARLVLKANPSQELDPYGTPIDLEFCILSQTFINVNVNPNLPFHPPFFRARGPGDLMKPGAKVSDDQG